MGGRPSYESNALRRLCELLQSHLEVEIDDSKLHKLIANHWNKLSPLAHAVHDLPPPMPPEVAAWLHRADCAVVEAAVLHRLNILTGNIRVEGRRVILTGPKS